MQHVLGGYIAMVLLFVKDGPHPFFSKADDVIARISQAVYEFMFSTR
jgi:hypothetical protein